MLFDAVEENCLKKKGIKRNIEIFHPGHVVVVSEVGVKEDPEAEAKLNIAEITRNTKFELLRQVTKFIPVCNLNLFSVDNFICTIANKVFCMYNV